jgi:hypothetical protein
MRVVQLADIDAGARVLLLVGSDERADLAEAICERARVADKYRKRLKLPHPAFGTGTIMSAATRFPQASRPTQNTSEYLKCIHMMTAAVIAGQCNHAL